MASNQLPAPAPSLEQDTGDVSRVAAQLASAQVEDSADKPPVTDSRRWQPVQFLSRSPGSRVFPSAVVHNNLLYVFGGHDGTVYRNDLLVFNFETRCWVTQLETLGDAPSPRDAHAAVVHAGWMCVFGGYDSKRYLNDFHRYHFESSTWKPITAAAGTPPGPRGGHTSVMHRDSMYIFGGCDGWNYFNDTYRFSFESNQWSPVRITGTTPGARSAPATVVHAGRGCMYVFGGYDGARSLNDLFEFNFETCTWSHLRTSGTPPSPRGGHTAVVYGDSMYSFGGKSGRSPFNDLCCLELESAVWTPVQIQTTSPAPRCAHVCVVHSSSLYIFGGYDGRRYFDDCFEFAIEVPFATAIFSLAGDLEQMVNNEQFADIRFSVDGQTVFAHKTILFARSEYFRRMLTGGYREAADETIEIHDVPHDVFLSVLAFLYTGRLPRELQPQTAVDLLAVANLYGIDPLKRICADVVGRNLHVDNAAAVLEAADAYGSASLRATCTEFIVNHFSEVVRSDAFRDLIRAETRDLVMRVLLEAADRGVVGDGAAPAAPAGGARASAAGSAGGTAGGAATPSAARGAAGGAAGGSAAPNRRYTNQ